ncbi:MAG: hypothetical protein ACRCXL_03570 [Dermatophilaceae bacterium]
MSIETGGGHRMPERSPGRSRTGAAVSGAVFFASGAALVAYVVTGAPLPLVLGTLIVAGAAALALTVWPDDAARRAWLARVQVGVPVGLVATGAYDISRYLLVQGAGFAASPFAAFPLFGQALLPDVGGGAAHAVAGVAFHLVNGTAFGCAYAVWFGHRRWWWGIGFALALEAFMLAIYPGWLDIRSLREFTTMSVAGHLVYGSVLGLGTRWWLGRSERRGAR